MLEDCPVTHERATVLRLVSIPVLGESARSILLRRGSMTEDLSHVISIVAAKTPSSLEEILDDKFRPRAETDPPYQVGRFGDGKFGVYYSALEEDTCKAEVAHHLPKDVDDPDPRSYTMIACRYEGSTANLLGKEGVHSELVSHTKTGWLFCQDLGRKAVERKLGGFLTASARQDGGTCVPVFTREALSAPQIRNSYRVTIRAGRVRYETE